MKRKLRVTIVAAVAAQLIAILAYGGVVNATSHNNVERHASLSVATSELRTQCYGCHSNYKRTTTSNRRIANVHKKHVSSSLLRMTCTTCHASADLKGTMDSGDVARKQVNPTVCLNCHGAFKSTAGGLTGHNGRTIAQIGQRNCKSCHNTNMSLAAGHAGATYLNNRATNHRSFCVKCHGGIQLFQATEN